MRSLLFAPGGSAKMMAKSLVSGADVAIFDIEDAVRPGAKGEARRLVVDALAERAPGCLRYVRVNPLGTEWCRDDLEAVLPARPDGIMLPKAADPQDLDRLDVMIAKHETSPRRGATKVIAICTETPAATLSLAARSWSHPRLTGLLWGGEDLSAALGASANRDGNGDYTAPFVFARNLCLYAARVAGVTPIDAVYTDFRDAAGLVREADAARRDGFTAKAAIHPSQVDIINERFTPTEAERSWAARVIAAFEGSAAGAVAIDGMMIDAPHLAQAKRIIAKVQTAMGRSTP
jgi:citrate lyase subunit beta/citryl-CoA lyase